LIGLAKIGELDLLPSHVIEAKSEVFGEFRNTVEDSEVDNKYAQQIDLAAVG